MDKRPSEIPFHQHFYGSLRTSQETLQIPYFLSHMNFSRAGAKIDWGISQQFITCSISPVHWAWSVRCCVLPLLWIRLLWHARGNRSQTLWPPPFCLFLCRAVVRFFFGDLSFLLWKLHRNGAKSQAHLWHKTRSELSMAAWRNTYEAGNRNYISSLHCTFDISQPSLPAAGQRNKTPGCNH